MSSMPCSLADWLLITALLVAAVAAASYDSLYRQPAVQAGGRLAADTLAEVLNVAGSLPLEVARRLGPVVLPARARAFNTASLTDDIIADFDAGLLNEDACLNITELVTKYGYAIEEHRVVTDDGYVLKLFRIPNRGPAVFLMHGLLGSADDFVVSGPESGLAYLLARAGRDVWMGNARGNKHSRRHLYMSPTEAHFWDFSWHEIGIHDLPAMIDYVLDTTKEYKLKYIGHSQGTTVFFVMASERPEYNEKISFMCALSPVAFMTEVRSPVVRMLASGGPVLQSVSETLGLYEFLPDNSVMRLVRRLACGSGPVSQLVCANSVFLVTGLGLDQLDISKLPVLLGHMPSGASMKQLVHYGQGVVSREFRLFDHGAAANLARYGSALPPSYRLARVSAPVSLFYSEADWLAHPADVDHLYNRLGNCVDIHKVPHHQFNHIDFLFGKDFKTLIYERMFKLMAHF